jgi:NAD(P)-dependent dehydrogenase (short-subunit alcohol dehydrogenase family)
VPRALVTGSSSGIGLATVVELARHGWTVEASMRDPERRTELDAAIDDAGVTHAVSVVALDVSSPTSVQAGVAAATAAGPLDAVVCNAGVALGGAFEDLSDAAIRALFDVNVFGVLDVARACLPAMRERGDGHLVVVSSSAGAHGTPGLSAYCASKWAVEGWAESVAHEVGPLGVRVALVEPGPYRTAIFERSPREVPTHSPYRALIDAVEGLIADEVAQLARDPQEVAAAIRRLLDRRSRRLRHPVGPEGRQAWAIRGVVPFSAQRYLVRRALKGAW